ncbi:MerR family transcriptional regulator [Vibrio sp. RC27]
MNIKAFSKHTGLSPHTLRFYEKIGLLSDVNRSSNGHRFYNARDLEWAKFIVRLKETAMPLEQIKRYADLRAQGDNTMLDRQILLKHHHERLKQQIEKQQTHLNALEQKIDFYDRKITP